MQGFCFYIDQSCVYIPEKKVLTVNYPKFRPVSCIYDGQMECESMPGIVASMSASGKEEMRDGLDSRQGEKSIIRGAAFAKLTATGF